MEHSPQNEHTLQAGKLFKIILHTKFYFPINVPTHNKTISCVLIQRVIIVPIIGFKHKDL